MFCSMLQEDTINSPAKMFDRIRENLREKRCLEEGFEFCKVLVVKAVSNVKQMLSLQVFTCSLYFIKLLKMTIIKVADEQEIIYKLCSYIEKISNDAILNRGKVFVGLSGGSVVKYLCEGLPKISTDWSKWVLAFCDERVVPENSEDSTFGTYEKLLIPEINVSRNQFIVIKQGITAEEAAKDYTEKLEQVFQSKNFKFDLLLLGMGPDGHTCSLFPNHPLLEETTLQVASITDSPKPPPERITLTYPVINKARNCIFAISGAGKADMVKRILKDKEDLPAARVNPEGSLFWIVDEAAAAQL